MIIKNNLDKKKEQNGLPIWKFGVAYVNECTNKKQFLDTHATAHWYELFDETVWIDELGKSSNGKLAVYDGKLILSVKHANDSSIIGRVNVNARH